jgi:hypothetical protein
MGAREKLNASYACGSLVVAAIIGAICQSGTVFVIAAVILLGLNVAAGEIRPTRRNR